MKIDVAFVLAALIGLQSGASASPMVDELNTIARRQSGNFHSPPVYPAPKGGWVPEWADAYAKAKKLVEQMTLAEKVNVTTSVGWQMG
jgi:beta-glucosidase